MSHETHVSVVVVNTGVSADHIVKFTGLVGVESGDEVVVRRAQGSNVLVDHRTERDLYSIELAGLRCSMTVLQHGRYLETLYLAANRYLATSNADTSLGVL